MSIVVGMDKAPGSSRSPLTHESKKGTPNTHRNVEIPQFCSFFLPLSVFSRPRSQAMLWQLSGMEVRKGENSEAGESFNPFLEVSSQEAEANPCCFFHSLLLLVGPQKSPNREAHSRAERTKLVNSKELKYTGESAEMLRKVTL